MVVAAPGPSDRSVPHHRRRRLDVRVTLHRQRSWLRITDWRMRTKLATVLVIPSVAFLVLAGVQTVSLAGQATVLNTFADEVAAGRQITDLVHGLQIERDRTAGELAAFQTLPGPARNLAGLGAVLRTDYKAVDGAVSAFRAAATPLASDRAGWRVAYGRVVQALDRLPDLRSSVATGAVSPATVFGNYSRMVDALLTLLAEPAPGVDRPDLTDAVQRYVELSRVKEINSRLRAKLYQAGSAGRYSPTDVAELSDLRAQQLTALAQFRVAATTPQLRRYEQAAADSRFQTAVAMEQSTIDGRTLLPPGPWWEASQQRLDLLRGVEAGILAEALDRADARRDAQLRRTLLVAGGILAILLVALLTSVAIGRSIARSLRSLREHALQVARGELPDTLQRLRSVTRGVPDIDVSPAPVRSRDEVGEVAEAFLAVHRSAVDLAVEQAVMRRNVNSMFVNLARRSQVLVERQLELLDELEREEADPDQLGNLFKLDHLAARMRRNDESLLVLAGYEANRRWSEPVALSTVVLAAVAEIEFYPRVQHDTDHELHVVGHAVADLVHLLAELLENATVFSPPDTVVRVTGRPSSGRTAVIEVADDGLGMGPAALAEANELLASPPAADVAASERMGLFVVSHLAARQGLRVRLSAAERGLVATVWLPPAMLAPPPQGQIAPHTGSAAAAGDATVPLPVTYLDHAVAGRRVLALGAGPSDDEPASGERPGPGERSAPAHLPGPGGPAVAGGRPGRVTVERASTARSVPTRAEDVLRGAGATAAGSAGSAWWSRQGGAATSAAPAAPPAVPVTGGVNANGLPVRIPMAQLPTPDDEPPPATSAYAPAHSVDPDPDAVGSMLSRFYGGVRRAEAEETTGAAVGGGREEE